jgi:hypothetical protein
MGGVRFARIADLGGTELRISASPVRLYNTLPN